MNNAPVNRFESKVGHQIDSTSNQIVSFRSHPPLPDNVHFHENLCTLLVRVSGSNECSTSEMQELYPHVTDR